MRVPQLQVVRIGRVGRPGVDGLVRVLTALGPTATIVRVLAAVALLLLALSACAQPSTSAGPSGSPSEPQKIPVEGGGTYTDVSPRGLEAMLRTKSFPLVNVHVPYEGEIEGTDAHIPYDQIDANLAKLPSDKSARIVLYCRSGSMSAIAARALVKLGYTDVWNLDGGMIAWQEAGLPLLNRGS